MSTDDLESFLDNDRACLIDQQGVLVFVAEAAETLSPARSSVLELVQTVCRDGATLVTASVKIACVNTPTFKPVRIPKLILEKLAARCA